MSKEELVLVAGAGGFIGGHLVGALRAEGYENIRAVDQKPLEDWYQTFDGVENHTLDLKERDACRIAAKNAAVVYNLAADMGGMGFIELNKAACMLSVHPAPPRSGRGRAVLFCILGVRLQCRQTEESESNGT